jgi:tRNA dimethylallyltransferase
VASRLHPHDDVRVIRALEKLRGGHGADGHAWSGAGRAEPYDVVFVGLTMMRGALNARLEARAAAMARAGLAEEVESLLARGYGAELSAMQGIGYREFVQVTRGELSVSEAIRLMQRDTVRYAKRQHTWFSREPGIEWMDVTDGNDPERVAARIAQRIDGAWKKGDRI